MAQRTRGFLRSVLTLGAFLVAFSCVLLALRFTGAARPGISQAGYHRIGTVSEAADFSAYVGLRRLEVEPPDRSVGELLAGYARRVAAGRPLGGVQGEYDPVADEIRIVGDEVRLQSRLPAPLRGELEHVVRHEYGHAALFDRLAELGLTTAEAAEVGLVQRGDPGARTTVPPELVPVLAEWDSGPDLVYGDPYLTSNLGEYLAESYARVLEGADVPVEARRYVLAAYR